MKRRHSSQTIKAAIMVLLMASSACTAIQTQTTQQTTASTAISNSNNQSIVTNSMPLLSVQYNGSDLLIASNDGSGTEMCYWFKKCMKNELFTFYCVGYRRVTRKNSSTYAIMSDKSIIWLNKTESDNIGPVGVEGYGDFVGGNHRWKTADANGNKGKGAYTDVRTAHCNSVIVTADDEQLKSSREITCHYIKVNVDNTLFNPLVEPKRNAKTLTSPLITENIEYLIIGNSIEVTVTHTYNKDTNVRRYYGMQSMFVDETTIYTPDGPYPAGTTPTNNLSFKKNQYPLFNRYVEMNADGWCQSSWITTTGLGQHSYLSNSNPIFTRGSNKSYHILLYGSKVKAKTPQRWHGVYTWGKPIVNNESLMVYAGYFGGKEIIYVDAKKQVKNAHVTIPYNWNGAQPIERSGNITTTVNGPVLTVTANAASSVILKN